MIEYYIGEFFNLLENDKSFTLEKDNYINMMISLLKKEWLNITLDNYKYSWDRINIIDFIKLEVITNLFFLIKENDININIINEIITLLINNNIDEKIILTIIWKNKKIKLWNESTSNFWFELDWNKERVFIRKNSDYLIEINLLWYLKNFLKSNIKYDDTIINDYSLKLDLDFKDRKKICDNFSSLEKNINEFNSSFWWKYKYYWNFKESLLKNSKAISWLNS